MPQKWLFRFVDKIPGFELAGKIYAGTIPSGQMGMLSRPKLKTDLCWWANRQNNGKNKQIGKIGLGYICRKYKLLYFESVYNYKFFCTQHALFQNRKYTIHLKYDKPNPLVSFNVKK